MPNLIVILFNLLYPVFYVEFHCKGCVWERLWRLKTHWRSKVFSRVACDKPSREVKHVLSTWLEYEESWQMVIAGFSKCFAGKAFPRDTRETFCFANLLYLIHQVSTHTIYTYIIHILRGVLFREKTLWEWEIVISTILYTIHCVFPQLLPLHFQILERLVAQTLTTPILSVKWGFGAAGKYWKKSFVW